MSTHHKSDTLTVCIPSWNRNSQLARTLQTLRHQAGNNLDIFVLDNHSDTPVTSSLPADLKQGLTIIRHPFNIGVAANLLRCFEVAQSDWLWILGDDDDIRPDAVSAILAAIKSHPDVAFFDFGHPARPAFLSPTTVCGPRETIQRMYYPRGHAEIYAWSDGHISNEVFNLNMFRPKMQLGYAYCHSLYPHIAMLFSLMDESAIVQFRGPQLAMTRRHVDRPPNYTRGDISRGWRILAELISDAEGKALFLHALTNSVEYGEHTTTGDSRDGVTIEGALHHLTEGNSQAALMICKHLITQSKNTFHASYVAGIACANIGNPSASLDFFKLALSSSSGAPRKMIAEAAFNAALVCLRVNEHTTDARGFLNRALSEWSEYPEALDLIKKMDGTPK